MEATVEALMQRSLKRGAWSLLGLLLTAVLFGMLAYFGIQWTLETGRIAAFWIGNALVIGFLLGRPKFDQVVALGLCFFSNMLVNLAIGDTAALAVGLAAANLLEMGARSSRPEPDATGRRLDAIWTRAPGSNRR